MCSNYFKLLLIVVFVFIASTGCLKKEKISCSSEVSCIELVNKAITSNNIQNAMTYYQKLFELQKTDDLCLLRKIALKASDNIFNGNINIDNQTKAIVIIDEFYNKTGTPFIGKQIGTDKIAKNIKLSEKIAKSLSASIIQHYNGKDYVEMVIPLLKDPDSDVRGITATCISNVNSKQYLPALEEIYKTDSQDYVKAYAIKGLGLYEFEKYKEEIINLYENGDLLSKTIAAGLLLKNGDNRGLDLLRKAIKNESEILNLRALEFLVRSKTMIEEEKIIAFLREARLLKNIYAAKLLGVMQKEEYHHLLLKEYKSNENKNKLALAIGLLEYDDLTGLDYIKKVMISPDYSETLFATEALIEYCNKKNMCIEE